MTFQVPGKILIVDDDKDYCDEIADYLGRYHFDVCKTHSPVEAEQALEEEDVAMILLDVMLPDKHGFDFCKELREKHTDTPILMVSAYCDSFEQVLGFEAGADYFLRKPFLPQELLARMKAIHRRMQNSEPAPEKDRSVLRTQNGLIVDPRKGQAALNGEKLTLTSFQFELLAYFVQNPQRLITRDEVMTKIHFYNVGALSRSVDINVSRIRKALDDSAEDPKFIRTIWRKGYYFVDQVV